MEEECVDILKVNGCLFDFVFFVLVWKGCQLLFSNMMEIFIDEGLEIEGEVEEDFVYVFEVFQFICSGQRWYILLEVIN